MGRRLRGGPVLPLRRPLARIRSGSRGDVADLHLSGSARALARLQGAIVVVVLRRQKGAGSTTTGCTSI